MRLLPRRAVLLVPSAVALAGGATLLVLDQQARVSLMPGIGGSSALVGRKLPAFSVAGLPGAHGFSSHDVAAAGRPVLLNFFASWCEPCQQEMPELALLAQHGVTIWGIAYEDKPSNTAAFLNRIRTPYQRVGSDLDGQASKAMGLVGVPESFLVDPDGRVRWAWVGKLNPDVARQDLLPLIGALKPGRGV
jgi:cytochrome c biogenesis protein CcmG/thiol:disulfide interchange protein DsbE